MLELKNVTKSYEDKKILDNINFNIKKGELVVLLGISGCGKTTLLKIIAGLEDLNKGKVLLNKKIVSKKEYYISPNQRNLNMVFQNLALWPHMTVKEHIDFALLPFKLKKKEKKHEIHKILNKVKLNKHINKYPYKLSGGEKQRLAIARSIATKPKILLLDEPLANLDLLLKTEIQKLLIKINQEENITMIYVTHDQIEALTIAEKIILMNKNKIEQIDTPYNLILNPKTKFVKNFMKFEHDFVKEMKKKLFY